MSRGAAGGVRHCRRPQVLLRVVPVGPDLDIVPGSGLRPGQLRLRRRERRSCEEGGRRQVRAVLAVCSEVRSGTPEGGEGGHCDGDDGGGLPRRSHRDQGQGKSEDAGGRLDLEENSGKTSAAAETVNKESQRNGMGWSVHNAGFPHQHLGFVHTTRPCERVLVYVVFVCISHAAVAFILFSSALVGIPPDRRGGQVAAGVGDHGHQQVS